MFWEDEAARAVADALDDRGFDARVARERFAGEDDDEDHPWVVLTDAPAALVEALLEEYDGWLDDAAPVDAPAATPLELPEAPRRVKGHFRGE
jgi:8-oxo-dGTP diphosphatase